MPNTAKSIRTTLRIPGDWSHPRELMERMPDGFRWTGETLISPDGAEVEFVTLPPDDQFPGIFASMCRRAATGDEMRIVHVPRVSRLIPRSAECFQRLRQGKAPWSLQLVCLPLPLHVAGQPMPSRRVDSGNMLGAGVLFSRQYAVPVERSDQDGWRLPERIT